MQNVLTWTFFKFLLERICWINCTWETLLEFHSKWNALVWMMKYFQTYLWNHLHKILVSPVSRNWQLGGSLTRHQIRGYFAETSLSDGLKQAKSGFKKKVQNYKIKNKKSGHNTRRLATLLLPHCTCHITVHSFIPWSFNSGGRNCQTKNIDRYFWIVQSNLSFVDNFLKQIIPISHLRQLCDPW